MRIVAGEWGGRRLLAPRAGMRPTQDRVRQILFDLLGDAVKEGPMLDLFAGTGAIGLEALSRGAPAAVFVEAAASIRAVLERNRAALGAEERSRVLGLRAESALLRLLRAGERFRWIVADPPYGGPDAPRILEWVGVQGLDLLQQPGGLVLETDRRQEMPEQGGSLRRVRIRPIGDTGLHFYARG